MSNCWKHKFHYYSICFVCLPVSFPGTQNSGDTPGLLLAFPFSFFALFHTLSFLQWKDEEAGGMSVGRRAELDGLVTIRGPLRHTDAETSCQLANLHRLTFITLASSVGRKENGSRMPADGPWHSSTVQYTDTAVKYSVVYARTYTLMHARTTHCRCLSSKVKTARCYAWRSSNGN